MLGLIRQRVNADRPEWLALVNRPGFDGKKRYQQIAEALIADIRAGRIAVGETLTGELELTRKFGVSRHTVREALRRLEDLGLIGRHQGVGTVVKARQPTQTYVQVVRSPDELLQYPADSRLTVLNSEEIRATRKLARDLGCTTGSRWQRISCLRTLKGSKLPICWVDLYVLPEYAAVASSIGRRFMPVYEMLEQRFGVKVATVEIDIKAGIVQDHKVEALSVPAGTPSLSVLRHYRDGERRLFQISVSEHPSERYTYSLQLKRGWQSGSGGGWSTI
jgi:DNA-binding GntR family transcriptional regulator